MDHSVKAMTDHRKMALARLFNRHRFENNELERLFQRYVFKLQHNSISSFVALFIVLTSVMAILSFILVQRPTITNMYHSLHCLVFVVLFVFLATKSMEDTYLNYVCYCILVFSIGFSIVNLPVSFGMDNTARVFAEGDGVWQIVLVIFLVYGKLPLKSFLAVGTGICLPILHLLVSGFITENQLNWKWQQVMNF